MYHVHGGSRSPGGQGYVRSVSGYLHGNFRLHDPDTARAEFACRRLDPHGGHQISSAQTHGGCACRCFVPCMQAGAPDAGIRVRHIREPLGKESAIFTRTARLPGR